MNCNTAFSRFFRRPAIAALVLIGLAVSAAAFASGPASGAPGNAPVVTLRRAPAVALRAGSSVYATLTFQVRDGFHLNSNHPKSAFLIPTTLNFATARTGLSVPSVRWPPAHELNFQFSRQPLAVFSGTFPVRILLRAAPGARSQVLRGRLRYQACNDILCQPPASLPLAIRVSVR